MSKLITCMEKQFKIFGTVLFWIAGIAFLIQLSCEKHHLDPQESTKRLMPIPQNVKLTVGNEFAALSWTYPDTLEVLMFRLFRRDTSSTEFYLIGDTETRAFQDSLVENGKIYGYQIQAIGKNREFSPRTETVFAQPNSYGVVIEYGQEYTNSRTVSVHLNAPATTEAYSISTEGINSFPGWQAYVSEIEWTFNPPDGKKYLYVRFRDELGIISQQVFGDSIILDTYAQISGITVAGNNSVYSADDTLFVQLDAGETGGQASFSVAELSQIPLFDDGTHGDAIANDSKYERAYVIPHQIEFINEHIQGNFIDIAANVALPVSSNRPITVQNFPNPVQLYPPLVIDSTTVTLSWSGNNNSDFFCYKVFHSLISNFPIDSPVDTTIQDQELTQFTIHGLIPNNSYYFKVLVVDMFELEIASNEVTAFLGTNILPEPVYLNQPTETTENSVALNWSKANAHYFHYYELVRWDSILTERSPDFKMKFYEIDSNSWCDTNLLPNKTYHYQVRVHNQQGKYSESNVIIIKTISEDTPLPVNLAMPQILDESSVKLTWSKSVDEKFAGYYIYRSTSSPVRIEGVPIGILNEAKNTEFTDRGLLQNHTYYYKVAVVNTLNKYSESNEVSISLQP